jgi:hypothetical protein
MPMLWSTGWRAGPIRGQRHRPAGADRQGPSFLRSAVSARVAALGIAVFTCTPDLMATALRHEDVHGWAADQDIKTVRAD